MKTDLDEKNERGSNGDGDGLLNDLHLPVSRSGLENISSNDAAPVGGMVVVLQIWLCSGGWIEDLMEEDIRIRCEKWQKFGAITIHIIVSGE